MTKKEIISQKITALFVYGRPPLVFAGLICAIAVMWTQNPIMYTIGVLFLFISMSFLLKTCYKKGKCVTWWVVMECGSGKVYRFYTQKTLLIENTSIHILNNKYPAQSLVMISRSHVWLGEVKSLFRVSI